MNNLSFRIRSHPKFKILVEELFKRQKVQPQFDDDFFKKFIVVKKYSPATIAKYETIFQKIVQIQVPDLQRNNPNYNLDWIFDAILNKKSDKLCDAKEAMKRFINMNLCQKYCCNITNMYAKFINIEAFCMPKGTRLPRDIEINERKNNRRNIQILPIYKKIIDFVKNDLITINGDTLLSPLQRKYIRATVLSIIINATALRIGEASQLSVADLENLIKNNHVTVRISRKADNRKYSNIYLRSECNDDLILAIELMKKHPKLFSTRHWDSSTKFSDFESLKEKLNENTFTSRMLRHQAASEMYNQGKPLAYIGQFMNHKHLKSTNHYIQKYAIIPQ